MSTRLCLIRHGQTDWNVARRIQGQIDTPLNACGQAQAQALSELCRRQKFAAIYCSDLSRAHETALRLAAHTDVPITLNSALRERHFGIFQGLTASVASAQFPDAYAHYKNRDPDFDFATGESLVALQNRIHAFLLELARTHQNQTLAVVSHAGVLDAVYRLATGMPLDAPRDFALNNCTLNWLRMDGSGLRVECWGEESGAGVAHAPLVE